MPSTYEVDQFGNIIIKTTNALGDHAELVGAGLQVMSTYFDLRTISGIGVDATLKQTAPLQATYAAVHGTLGAAYKLGRALGAIGLAADLGSKAISIAQAEDPRREAFAQTVDFAGEVVAGMAGDAAGSETGPFAPLVGAGTSWAFEQSHIGYVAGTMAYDYGGGAISNGIDYTAKEVVDEKNFLISKALAAAIPTFHCFPAGTAILTDHGVERPVETIEEGDLVAAFNGMGSLVARRVVGLSQSVTDTWIELANGLVVTPGHRFLTPDGSFSSIGDILAVGGAIVLADGATAYVTGRYIHYSEATADLFEQAQGYAYDFEGSAALAPEFKRGWKTYNFEVEDLHTYVAGGVRVHNASPPYILSSTGQQLHELLTPVYDSHTGQWELMAAYRAPGWPTGDIIDTVAINPAGYASKASGEELFPVVVDRYNADTNTF
jgi:hypothetical protein